MKKNYLSPAIEATEVMVEAGIATSLMTGSTFNLTGYDEENVENVAW